MEQPVLWIIYSPDFYKYDRLELRNENLQHLDTYDAELSSRKKTNRKSLSLDCVFVHYFIRELSISLFYRTCVIGNVRLWEGPDLLLLTSTKKDLIDYDWNDRMYELVRERCEIDHALSWLSTLGGAFSALGDYFEKCADTAGQISVHQLKLALRMGDPIVQSRCRLYLSLSLIQKKRFKLAQRIIRKEYHLANSQTVVDVRLVKMCKGIWSKLQYEYSVYRNKRQIKR